MLSREGRKGPPSTQRKSKTEIFGLKQRLQAFILGFLGVLSTFAYFARDFLKLLDFSFTILYTSVSAPPIAIESRTWRILGCVGVMGLGSNSKAFARRAQRAAKYAKKI